MGCEKSKIIALACDSSLSTGEGFLAHSIIDLMSERYFVSIYDDFVMRRLGCHRLLRDRFLPMYVFAVCVVQRLAGNQVILLNYVPIWNFLNCFLTRCGVRLGPVTGSALMVPARSSWHVRFMRLQVQSLLIRISCMLLSRHTPLWCATPSVYQTLKKAGLKQLYFGFPFLSRIEIQSPQPVKFDVFIYSGTHDIKNHEAVRQWFQTIASTNLKVCYVGPNLPLKYSHVWTYEHLHTDVFDTKLACSSLYLSFSFEDAGITGFKALAFGVPVLCPRSSGLANALEYREMYCYSDVYDSSDILQRVEQLLPAAQQRLISDACRTFFIKLKDQSTASASAWLGAL